MLPCAGPGSWACGHPHSGRAGIAAKAVGTGKGLSLGVALTCRSIVCLNGGEVGLEQKTRNACALETH